MIGETCDNCGRCIAADDDEATQYWTHDDEDGAKHYVDGVFACCLECVYELQDGDCAAVADAIELGLDYLN